MNVSCWYDLAEHVIPHLACVAKMVDAIVPAQVICERIHSSCTKLSNHGTKLAPELFDCYITTKSQLQSVQKKRTKDKWVQNTFKISEELLEDALALEIEDVEECGTNELESKQQVKKQQFGKQKGKKKMRNKPFFPQKRENDINDIDDDDDDIETKI